MPVRYPSDPRREVPYNKSYQPNFLIRQIIRFEMAGRLRLRQTAENPNTSKSSNSPSGLQLTSGLSACHVVIFTSLNADSSPAFNRDPFMWKRRT